MFELKFSKLIIKVLLIKTKIESKLMNMKKS